MARKLIKPFTRTEMKILVYNKVKGGMSYEKACEEVKKQIEQVKENHKKSKKKKDFKEEFQKLKHEQETD